jgi:hypothetical protein
MSRRLRRILFIAFACVLFPAGLAMAQSLEPRRWSHLPVGANFAGVGYAYSDVDISLDPALELEDVRGDIHTTVISYTRVLDVFGKSGRINFSVPYSLGRWDGLLQGEPASTRRHGFNDPRIRFAVNLLGSPAQRGAAFTQRYANTIVGVALDITAPLGEYQEGRLINLGTNRWTIRPQIGVVHSWDKWAAELTTSAWIFTDNDDFGGDQTREQDPLVSIQSHLIYTFRPGLWASLSAAYGGGAQSTIDGVQANDKTGNFLVSAAIGIPINRRQGFKLAYIHGETNKNTGSDYDSVLLVYSIMWGG